jgi:hypothetical protein
MLLFQLARTRAFHLIFSIAAHARFKLNFISKARAFNIIGIGPFGQLETALGRFVATIFNASLSRQQSDIAVCEYHFDGYSILYVQNPHLTLGTPESYHRRTYRGRFSFEFRRQVPYKAGQEHLETSGQDKSRPSQRTAGIPASL